MRGDSSWLLQEDIACPDFDLEPNGENFEEYDQEDADQIDGSVESSIAVNKKSAGDYGRSLLTGFKNVVNRVTGLAPRAGGSPRESTEELGEPVAQTYSEQLQQSVEDRGGDFAFGAFRLAASQSVGLLRAVQVPSVPTGIFEHFAVHLSNSRYNYNNPNPDGACQYGLYASADGSIKTWVICRGYGDLGGLLPDWFCFNFMKRVVTRLGSTNVSDSTASRNVLRHTFAELGDDMLSMLERIERNEGGKIDTAGTGVTATCGIMSSNSTVVIAILGNQPTHHVAVKNLRFAGQTVRYCTTKELFRTLHVYTKREATRIDEKLALLRDVEMKQTRCNQPNARKLIAELKLHEATLPQLTAIPQGEAEASRLCEQKFSQSCIAKYNITRGVGFLHSDELGVSTVPDFVVIQLARVPDEIASPSSIPREFILSASSPLFWKIRPPHEVASHMVQLMCDPEDPKTLQEALDEVSARVRVESVAKSHASFNIEEWCVLCVPLS